MEKKSSTGQQIFEAAGAILGWLAIIGQLCLIVLNRTVSLGETIIRFFSYFTILTNILVALCFTACLQKKISFFSKPSTLAATTVYIFIVGLIYNTILRFLWQLTGWQWLVNEGLHVLMPVLFIVYWLVFAPKTGLKWKMAFDWLLYPLIYEIYILILGALSGFYPYPFIDVGQLGYPRCLLHGVLLLLLFLLVSLLTIALARRAGKSKTPV